MAYPDDVLADGEEVRLHVHPHWKMLVLPVLVFLLTVAAGSYLAALIGTQSWAWIGWIALAVIGGVVIIWFTVVPVIRWRTTHFVVTTRRVLVREGVLHRQGLDIPLNRVSSVQFRHSLVERLLGCGTLVLESSSDEPVEFEDIPRVERVHAMIYGPDLDERAADKQADESADDRS